MLTFVKNLKLKKKFKFVILNNKINFIKKINFNFFKNIITEKKPIRSFLLKEIVFNNFFIYNKISLKLNLIKFLNLNYFNLVLKKKINFSKQLFYKKNENNFIINKLKKKLFIIKTKKNNLWRQLTINYYKSDSNIIKKKLVNYKTIDFKNIIKKKNFDLNFILKYNSLLFFQKFYKLYNISVEDQPFNFLKFADIVLKSVKFNYFLVNLNKNKLSFNYKNVIYLKNYIFPIINKNLFFKYVKVINNKLNLKKKKLFINLFSCLNYFKKYSKLIKFSKRKKKKFKFWRRKYYYSFEDKFFVPHKGFLIILTQKRNRVVRGIYKGFLQQARGKKLLKRLKPFFVKVKKFIFTHSRKVKGKRK